MPPKKQQSKKPATQPAAPEQNNPGPQALRNFATRIAPSLARVRAQAQKIQELLGRWDDMGGGTGLLGGNLIALIGHSVLNDQVNRLSDAASSGREAPSDAAEHAEFVGEVVGEYAALIKVLAEIELEPGNRLGTEWAAISDGLLEQAYELQDAAQELELALEDDGEAPEPPGTFQGMQGVSRDLLHDVWRKSQSGEPLQGELAKLASILRDHPEYRVAWESPAAVKDPHYTLEGVNPFVHVAMHSAVEDQLGNNDPPEVAETLTRLVAAGVSRHDAIHRIANTLVEQIWRMQKEKKNFDRPAYVRALAQL